MMLGEEEGLVCEVKCRRKVASGRKAEGAIRYLVNARSFQLECAGELDEALLVSDLLYADKTMVWSKKERSKISLCRRIILAEWIKC